MIKYIVILAIGFVAYDTFMKSSPNKISSSDYKFQVLFPDKPTEITKIIDLPTFGKIKLTNYYVKSPELMCTVSISDYLEKKEVIIDIYELIDVAKRDLLKGFKGSITREEFIYSGMANGYQFNLLTKSKKLLQSRIFTNENNVYNVLCQYQNSDEYKVKVNDFMQSFTFI